MAMQPAGKGVAVISKNDTSPHVLVETQHNIKPEDIAPNARKVLQRLNEAGYEAYLVGGGVRDLLLGMHPKDFDIATCATPEQVKAIFSNCRLIGRRFRLAHVYFGREIIEVATFRGDGKAEVRHSKNGRITRDNVYGTLEEDAWRRDFTANALYYSLADGAVYDYVEGLKDIDQRVMRVIGRPVVRYQEDPVRMIRAVRLATKLGFQIEEQAKQAIVSEQAALADVPPARLFDESLKLFMSGYGRQTFEQLRKYGLLSYLSDEAELALSSKDADLAEALMLGALDSTDKRLKIGKSVTPAFLFAAFLWPSVKVRLSQLKAQGKNEQDAVTLAASEALSRQAQQVSIQKRFSLMMREIWQLQWRLEQRRPRMIFRVLSHPRFRAAYDFLLLRSESGELPMSLANWWTEIQACDQPTQTAMVKQLGGGPDKKRRRRRKRPAEKTG